VCFADFVTIADKIDAFCVAAKMLFLSIDKKI